MIIKDIPEKVAPDTAYQNAKQNSDKQNAKIEHDKALGRVIVGLMKDDTELFKQYSDNPEFKRWLADTVLWMTYRPATRQRQHVMARRAFHPSGSNRGDAVSVETIAPNGRCERPVFCPSRPAPHDPERNNRLRSSPF